MSEDIKERIRKIIAEHLDKQLSEVTDDASFVDDLGADSLDQVELVMHFEEEFGCEIPDEAAEKITNLADAVKYIQENAKENI
jgi:acyl carrier protein